MNKGIRRTVILSAILIVIGLIAAIVGFAGGGLNSINLTQDGFHIIYGNDTGADGSSINGNNLISKSFDDFDEIDLEMDAFSINFVAGNEFSVNGRVDERRGAPSVEVKDGVLVIRDNWDENRNRWISLINRSILSNGILGWINASYNGFKFGMPDITITYPADKVFESVRIDGAAVGIAIDGLSAKSMNVDCDAGNFRYTNGKADKLSISIAAGNCDLRNVDGGVMDVTLEAGVLSATKLICSGFRANVDMGSANVSGALAGNITIRTNMGNTVLKTSLPEHDYSYALRATMGNVSVNGNTVTSGDINLKNSDAMNHINAESNMGNVAINFE